MSGAFDVSVIIPTRPKEPFLQATLASIETQSYRPKEIIVIVEEQNPHWVNYCETELTIPCRFLLNNQSVSYKRNLGIESAHSNWIAFCDADDLWRPHKLELQKQTLLTNPNTILICGAADRIDEQGKPLTKAGRQQIGWSGQVCEYLMRRNYVITSSVVTLRSALQEVGGFRPVGEPIGKDQMEDWDLWLRLSRLGEFRFIQEALIQYRVHKNQTIIKLLPNEREYLVNRILDDFHTGNANQFLQTPYEKAKANWYMQLAFWYLRADQADEARRCLDFARTLNSSIRKSPIYLILSILGKLPQSIQRLFPYDFIYRRW